jgi:hypothetical protein
MNETPTLNHPNRIRGWEEPLIVWGIYAAIGIAIFITYARFPASDFYNVSGSGVSGSASRVLVYLNFPVAFAAIALLGFAVSSLIHRDASFSRRGRQVIGFTAVLALLLCLVAALPGVVDQGDLDARTVNVIPPIGVALVVLLTIIGIRCGATFTSRPWGRWDRNGAIAIGVLLFFALPWALADLGFYIGDVPLIGRIFMSKDFVPAGDTLRAVHLGDHHGYNGFIFIVAAIILGRKLRDIQPASLRVATGWYLAFMMVYGLANYLNDIWLEQVVKRGWATYEIPSMLVPKLKPSWGLVVLGTIAARYLFFRGHVERRKTSEPTLAPAKPVATPKR